MTNHSHDDDSRLRDALRDAAPSAPFDAERVRARIEESAHAVRGPGRPARRSGRPPALVWGGRAAAAVIVFLAGEWYGRSNAESGPIPPSQANQIVDVPAGVPGPAQVPMSIQSAGTGYVASLALLSEMRDQLTPAQREQARQVALAVLTGAIAELAAGDDGRLPGGVLATVLGHGVSTGGPGDAVVRYR